METFLDAPPLTALSVAGFAGLDRLELVAADSAGGIHLVDAAGGVRSVPAGGPLAGEVLCADLDGDDQSDLLALRADGTLLGWDARLDPLPAFPRRFPAGFARTPLVIDAGGVRYVAAVDTLGRLWSIPLGPAGHPAPWPAARGGGARAAFLDHARATPLAPAVSRLAWEPGESGAGSLCWSGSGLEELAALRVRAEGPAGVLWQGPSAASGCAPVTVPSEAPDLVLEGLGRDGLWSGLGRVSPVPAARFRLAAAAPNPFREGVRMAWSGASGPVRLRVYDVRGRLVHEAAGAGSAGSLTWTGRDRSGRPAAPGIYFLRATDGAGTAAQRLVKIS